MPFSKQLRQLDQKLAEPSGQCNTRSARTLGLDQCLKAENPFLDMKTIESVQTMQSNRTFSLQLMMWCFHSSSIRTIFNEKYEFETQKMNVQNMLKI